MYFRNPSGGKTMGLKISILTLSALVVLANHTGLAQPLPERSVADAQRDLNSHPFEMLDFFGAKPGWRVIDLFAGNGYYAEVLAHVVGPEGKVYLHNNQAYMGFAKDLAKRMQNNRLPNVVPYQRETRDINLPSNSVDMALLVMAYHDVYFAQNGWDVRVEPMLKTMHRILKPGGILAIIDHHAESGSGTAAVQALHRIDAEFARQDIERFGFTLQATSSLLENAQDDLTKSVFDPAVKGKTSRFAYRFVKRASDE